MSEFELCKSILGGPFVYPRPTYLLPGSRVQGSRAFLPRCRSRATVSTQPLCPSSSHPYAPSHDLAPTLEFAFCRSSIGAPCVDPNKWCVLIGRGCSLERHW